MAHPSLSAIAHVSCPRIAGTRDKVIHDYCGVDIELVWTVATTTLDRLRHTYKPFCRQNSNSREGLHNTGLELTLRSSYPQEAFALQLTLLGKHFGSRSSNPRR
jgi:hypothetical protein